MNPRFAEGYDKVVKTANFLGSNLGRMVPLPNNQAMSLVGDLAAPRICFYDLMVCPQPIYDISPGMRENFQEGDVKNIEGFFLAAEKQLGRIVGEIYQNG